MKIKAGIVIAVLALILFAVRMGITQADSLSLVKCGQTLPVEFNPTNIDINDQKKTEYTQRVQTIFNQVCDQYKQYSLSKAPGSGNPKLIKSVILDSLSRLNSKIYDYDERSKKGIIDTGVYYPKRETYYINSTIFQYPDIYNRGFAHEFIHTFQPGYYVDPSQLKKDYINEGITEYFARKIYYAEGKYDYPAEVITNLSQAFDRINPDSEKNGLGGDKYFYTLAVDGTVDKYIDKQFNPYLPKGQTSAFSKISYALKQEAAGKPHEDIVAWLDSIQPTDTAKEEPPSLNIPNQTPATTLPTSENVPNEDPISEGASNTKPPTDANIDNADGQNQSNYIGIMTDSLLPKVGDNLNIFVTGKFPGKDQRRVDLFISDSLASDQNSKWHIKCSSASKNSLCPAQVDGEYFELKYSWDTKKATSKAGEHKIRVIVWNETELPKIGLGDNSKLANLAETKGLAFVDSSLVLSGADVLKSAEITQAESGNIDLSGTLKQPGTASQVDLTVEDLKNYQRQTIALTPDGDGNFSTTNTTAINNLLPIIFPKTSAEQNTPDIAIVRIENGRLKAYDSNKKEVALPPIPSLDKKANSAEYDIKTGNITIKAKGGKVITTYQLSPLTRKTSATVNPDINKTIGFGNIMNSLRLLSDSDLTANPNKVFQKRILSLINFIFAIGSALMFFMAVWSGLIYIFSFGNEEATTKAKKNFVNIITGLILMLGSFSILQILRAIISTGKFGA